MSLRLGYGLNGFAGHRLADACAVVSGLGYRGVGLTLDQPHFDPFGDLPGQIAHARRCLETNALASVVETGSRYVLDPWHKHEPTLVSTEGRERRVELLCRAVRIAADLGSEAVSCWSGTAPAGVSRTALWRRVLDGLGPVLDDAAALGVTVCVEPEPGMFLATLDDVLELRTRLGHPEHLRVTLDLGHLACNEPRTPADTVRHAGSLIANVQVDDMVRDVHEHLELGTGELDLDAVLAALLETGYTGLACVELPRHSHAAPVVAASTMDALQASLGRLGAVAPVPGGAR
ncbi:sugar phosphate isomerase/epimerase [Nocardioides sp. zg-DK7169]|uniref:sugar phosphate isomerase/epimerase family protein n=1 Tax=Nocardioides sp. zg-DK7169 TaxID=2736600 RepID=UPI001555B6DD|nr:sugar phosphate isomerase/epimerase family protein [Nocardioides sp. zg-DK7169]NPC96200.1 sugar phosphate isomerase/epimerase [Nocardioides sp. zg-DK7169]